MSHLLMPLFAAFLIIGAGFLFCVSTELWLRWEMRHALRQSKAAGTPPSQLQNNDLENASRGDIGIRLHPITMRLATIAHFLSSFARFLIPLVILGCIVVAWLHRGLG